MSKSQQITEGLIVGLPLPEWGHTKPQCGLLAKIVHAHRIKVVLFTGVKVVEKALDEIERLSVINSDEDIKNLIQVVGLPMPSGSFQNAPYFSAFVEAYRALYSKEPITIAPGSDTSYRPTSFPKLAIVDIFCYDGLKGIRSISGSNVPVFAMQAGTATKDLYLFGPENLGCIGDLASKISKITTEDPEAREKELALTYRGFDETLVQLAGLPLMHDYEHSPQKEPVPVNRALVTIFSANTHRLLLDCDGVIHITNKAYEGPAVEKWKEWYGTKPTVVIGPVSPPSSAADTERERKYHPTGKDVEAFLDRALAKFGPHSVIYISFGTIWWSSEPEKIWTFVDVLLEQGIPFVFSHASPHAIVPEEVSAKVKASGLGYLSNWLPQQLILSHKACGWFVSHCGHNSVMESLSAGVPLICWPFNGDQPTNAVNVAYVHEVGYELFEVRNGLGLRPIHRLGDKAPRGTLEAVRQEAIDVLTKARGKDGEAKRAKAQWFSKQFAKTWAEGGEGWSELKKLVDRLA